MTDRQNSQIEKIILDQPSTNYNQDNPQTINDYPSTPQESIDRLEYERKLHSILLSLHEQQSAIASISIKVEAITTAAAIQSTILDLTLQPLIAGGIFGLDNEPSTQLTDTQIEPLNPITNSFKFYFNFQQPRYNYHYYKLNHTHTPSKSFTDAQFFSMLTDWIRWSSSYFRHGYSPFPYLLDQYVNPTTTTTTYTTNTTILLIINKMVYFTDVLPATNNTNLPFCRLRWVVIGNIMFSSFLFSLTAPLSTCVTGFF